MKNNIPKIIHYCWFGGAEIPDNIQKFIDGWKEKLPDYEFKKWDEKNYNIEQSCDYVKEAFVAKKWAFVTDYVRLDVCYKYGGIYLDVDVELIKNLDDILELDAFCGFEQGEKETDLEVNTGLIVGMKKGSKIGKILRDDYLTKKFIKEDGNYDTTPCPQIQTKKLKGFGLECNNKKQIIEGMTVFPYEYFCPMNQYTGETTITKNTYSIHHYSGSWYNEADQLRRKLRMKYSKFGKFGSDILSSIVAYKKYYGFWGMWKEIFKKLIGKK